MLSATLWRDRLSFLLGLTKGNKSSIPVNIYPETAYLGLVRSESKRSAQSGHPCRILLVYCTNAEGLVVPMASELADKATSVLSMSVRDTDYVGWYRQGRILGVLLTALRPDSVDDGCDKLKTRLVDRLRGDPALTDDHSFQMRACELGELATVKASDHPAPSPDSKDYVL